MSRVAPKTVWVQFTVDQHKRLRAAASYHGKSMGRFCLDLAMAEVVRTEGDIRAREEEKEIVIRTREQQKRRPKSRGLGISVHSTPPASAAPPAIAPLPADRIERLALYASCARDPEERERRVRAAEEMLAASASTQAEAENLVRDLRERVTRAAQIPQNGAGVSQKTILPSSIGLRL